MKKEKLSVCAIVPARSGSQGIKDKNIVFWKGKRLIMHTYDFLIKKNCKSSNWRRTDPTKKTNVYCSKWRMDQKRIY